MMPRTRLLLLLAACISTGTQAAPQPEGWELAGRLGLAQYLVVPEASARDKAYYDAIVDQVCERGATCFLRFFTNSRKAAVGVPLPDEIEQEATAIFQRSAKYQREEFRWSCRLKLPDSGCF